MLRVCQQENRLKSSRLVSGMRPPRFVLFDSSYAPNRGGTSHRDLVGRLDFQSFR